MLQCHYRPHCMSSPSVHMSICLNRTGSSTGVKQWTVLSSVSQQLPNSSC